MSVYGLALAARLFALLLIDTVTVVLAPPASVPLVEKRLSQVCATDAVQLMELLPVF